MKQNKVILFFGYGNGSEYVLNPLYLHMMKMGYTCIELDMMKVFDTMKILDNLLEKKVEVVFVTSAHLFMDHINFSQYVNLGEEEIVSALEIIDYLKPVKSIYYPHDLVTPLLEQDLKWLSLFDVLLSPLPTLNHLTRYTDVVEVGWIKKDQLLKLLRPSIDVTGNINIALSLSNVRYYLSLGHENAYKIWKPFFDLNIGVKLPNWPGSYEFENYLRSKGVNVFPANTNVFDLIRDHDIIITNSTTSVSIEASLSGRMVLNIFDGVTEVQEQRRYSQGIPCIETLSFEQCLGEIHKFTRGERKLNEFDEILMPFNYALATEVISS